MKPEIEFSNAAQRLRTASDTPLEADVVQYVGDWLGCLAMLDPSERGGDTCGWCGSNHALDIARTVNGGRR
ncbi:hypothetical protein [Streptomyces swartbergensis]|uniref:Uncharacterized protein n=1 Tax=Streptomyces swartbergensis TaxID=487165 RepID=A0A243S6V8_9ACTN|nr:hypothetical protein [Streptomyces swartbergensis]OUD03346.1 hypothetical protein CA983_10070 [Streptomyces swartbergensis]